MDIYICDHCTIEFGCERGQPVVCRSCGKEQTPPAYRLSVEHAVPQQQIETAMTQTKPLSRLKRVFGRRKK